MLDKKQQRSSTNIYTIYVANYKFIQLCINYVADLCSNYYLAPRYRALCKSSC